MGAQGAIPASHGILIARRAIRPHADRMKQPVLFLLFSAALIAQDTSGTGSLRGRVPNAPETEVCILDGPCERTGPDGAFRFSALRPGTYQIGIRQQRSAVEIRAGLETEVEIAVAELQLERQTIEVTASSLVAPEEIRTSVHIVEATGVRSSAAGIKDVSRHLQSLPGVVFGAADFVNDLIVRGGHPQENLYIVDNVEVPNINHFATLVATGGPWGLFNSEMLAEVTFLTGGYPAAYNNRLSSVLQLTQREGSRERIRGQATMGFGGTGGIAEGPLGKKGAWIVSARRSIYDLFTDDLGFGGVPIYTNLQSKVVYDLNSSNRLWFSSIGGRDQVSSRPKASKRLQEADPYNIDVKGWRNGTGLNWQQLFGSRGVGLLGLAHSRTSVDDLVKDIRLADSTIYRSRSSEDELTAKYDVTLNVPGVGRLQAGASVRWLLPNHRTQAPFGVENPFSQEIARVNPIDLSPKATIRQRSAYAQLSRSLTSRLSITAGARADRYGYLNATRISPRVGLTLRLTERLSAQASAGSYVQQPAFTFLVAAPVNRGLVPMRSNHLVSGLTWVPSSTLRFTAEAYEKRYADYPVSLEFPQVTMASTVIWGASYLMTPLTSAGRGRVRGLELNAEKKITNHWHGQANLTIASSRHAALDGMMRPGAYDSRYVANLIGGYRFNERWSVAARFVHASGRPYTPFNIAKSTEQNRGVLDLGRVNAARATAYQRLDLRVDRDFRVRGKTFNVYGGIQNAFDRKNFFGEVWNFRTNKPKTDHQTGAFPIFGFEWRLL